MTFFNPRRRQAGLTIAELMVAMALGLAVLLASGSLLITSVRSHAAVTEASEMDDSGRYAVDALARAIRLAVHGKAGAIEGGAVAIGRRAAAGKAQGQHVAAIGVVRHGHLDAGAGALP